jgi:hypothetical protein
MSVPTEALRRFWNDLRERARVQRLSATQHWPRKLARKTKLPNCQSSSRTLAPKPR